MGRFDGRRCLSLPEVRPRHALPVVTAAAIGIVSSLLAWSVVSQLESRYADHEFTVRASNQAKVLQEGIDDYLSKLSVLRAFFDASESQVTRSEFEIFSRELIEGRTAIYN